MEENRMLTVLLEEAVAEWWKKKKYFASPSTLIIGAMEELGELAADILVSECSDFTPSPHKETKDWHRNNIPYEIGDCITYLISLCYVLGISPKFKWLEEINNEY